MISCLQEDAQATESYYKWQIARRHLLEGKYDAAQSLGYGVHRTMAGSSFYCGPPSGWKVVAKHRLVLRKHWQSWKKRRMSLGSWLVLSRALAQEQNLESTILRVRVALTSKSISTASRERRNCQLAWQNTLVMRSRDRPTLPFSLPFFRLFSRLKARNSVNELSMVSLAVSFLIKDQLSDILGTTAHRSNNISHRTSIW